MMRKTYGHVDIGRVEIEGGWYDGESWSFEAHCGYWPLVKRICIVYLQVAKLCLSVSIRLGPSDAVQVAEPRVKRPKPSAGKWYIVEGNEDRGPGREVSPGECGDDNIPDFALGETLLFHPSWTDGHSGKLRAGGKGYPTHCCFYPARAVLRETSAPAPEATE